MFCHVNLFFTKFAFFSGKWFKCQICQWIEPESVDFINHITHVHSMEYKSYLEKFANPWVVKNVFTCQLCDQVGYFFKDVFCIIVTRVPDTIVWFLSPDEVLG